jgi:CHASE3 domain sensor protein
MQFSVRYWRQLVAMGFAIGLVGLNAWLLFSSFNQLSEAGRWLREALDVRQTLVGIEADVIDAEASQRGYLITSDHAYLEP